MRASACPVFLAAAMVVAAARGELGDLHLQATPEIRTAYISLGKIVEDRPMQTTAIKGSVDGDFLGRLGVTFWGVSSLTDRKDYVHRHALYFNDIGPYWGYDIAFAKDWTLKSELSRQWSLFHGYEPEYESSAHSIHWWQLDQELANPYLTPFWRLRKVIRPMDLFYFKAGVKRRFAFLEDFYILPSVFLEGGDVTNIERRLGRRPNGGRYNNPTVCSITFRLELGWRISKNFTAFAAVDQYDVVLKSGRNAIRDSSDLSAHTDLTVGSVGVRLSF